MASEGERVRGKALIEAIREKTNEGKTLEEIADELKISKNWVSKLKARAGLQKKGSEILSWIDANPEVKNWLREIRGGEAHDSTKTIFALVLKKYCEFRGKTPSDLLDEAEADIKLDRKKRKVKSYLLDFRELLKKEGMSKNTISTYMTAIRSFFKSSEVPLPALSNVSTEVEHEKKEFDRDRVRQLLSVCGVRERAIFLTMFQSGLAANEISNLKMGDLKEVTDEITVLRLRREKVNGYKFTTFLGRDARKAIEDYLKVRNEGNLLPGLPEISKQAKVSGDDTYLFVTYDRHIGKWNKMKPGAISMSMKQVCKKLGWYNGEKFNPYRPHALRSSFATILSNAGVPKMFVDHMLGHKQSSKTDEAYFKAHFDRLFKYYHDNEHLLSITEGEVIPDSKYSELMIELGKRNGEIQELKEKLVALEDRLLRYEYDGFDENFITMMVERVKKELKV